jgi:hypothetical protein
MSSVNDKTFGPALIRGAVYTGEALEKCLGVSDKTIKQWADNGLPRTKPAGSAKYLYLSDDVIAFLFPSSRR